MAGKPHSENSRSLSHRLYCGFLMTQAPIGHSASEWPRAAGIRDVLCGATLVADPGNDARPEAADAPSGTDKTIAAVLGEIVWLMSQSAEFKQYLISDLEWLVMPPILLRQFRLFYHQGRPVAVVLYARVSSEVEKRMDAGVPTLRPDHWQSGEKVRIVKIISPFEEGEKFADETLKSLPIGTAGSAA